MNEMSTIGTAGAEIEDVQSSADMRRIAIDKVGIKDIRHPVRIKDRSGGEQHTVANFNMYVNLPHNFKGTHMSRFVEILNLHEREISVDSFKEMLAEMTDRLEADVRSYRNAVSVFHQQDRAGVGRAELDGLRRHADRRDP